MLRVAHSLQLDKPIECEFMIIIILCVRKKSFVCVVRTHIEIVATKCESLLLTKSKLRATEKIEEDEVYFFLLSFGCGK